MPKIRRITIDNFRSINHLEIETTDLTVLVGDNDVGKSNVLRALNLFFNGKTNPGTDFNFADDYNRYAVPSAKKAKEITVELRLELPESYRRNNGDLICWRKTWRADGLLVAHDFWGIRLERKKRGAGFKETIIPLPSHSKAPPLLNKIQFEYVPAIRSAEFFRTLRGRIYRVIAEVAEKVRESSTQFETVIGSAVSDLLSDISVELKDNSTLRLPNDLTSMFESLDFLSGEKSISLDSRGDGIKARYIPLILKFIAEKSKEMPGIAPTFIWAYEEPENNLEFRRAQELADAFKKLAEDALSQVLLTTHSPIFYNMHRSCENEGLCTAYHLVSAGPEQGIQATSASEASASLDESMGAMAIIAPHIKAAQDALSDAINQASDLKRQLDESNRNGLPTLFVEGATEYLLFKDLLDRLRPEAAPLVFLAKPPQRAGANYVTNMLRSWEYRIKHLPPPERVRAVGLVDGDLEGQKAFERFFQESNPWRHVSLMKLGPPAHLAEAIRLGVDIPITLEELWPASQWERADAEGWLVDRPKKGLISSALTDRLVQEDARLSDVIQPAWRIYFEKVTNGDLEAHAKVEWIFSILELSRDDLARAAVEPLRVLDQALATLHLPVPAAAQTAETAETAQAA